MDPRSMTKRRRGDLLQCNSHVVSVYHVRYFEWGSLFLVSIFGFGVKKKSCASPLRSYEENVTNLQIKKDQKTDCPIASIWMFGLVSHKIIPQKQEISMQHHIQLPMQVWHISHLDNDLQKQI